MTNKHTRDLGAFLLGAACYPLLELAVRRRSAPCSSGCGRMNGRLRRRVRWPGRCALGALIITSFELGVGLVVNRWLHWNVWDYSRVPGNLLGQICPRFCLYWFLLNLPLLPLCRALGY